MKTKSRLALFATTAFASMSAMAQSVDPFAAAVAEATTKVTSYATSLVGLAAVAVVFVIAAKYVKKIPRAS